LAALAEQNRACKPVHDVIQVEKLQKETRDSHADQSERLAPEWLNATLRALEMLHFGAEPDWDADPEEESSDVLGYI
jgi:hypothetical protein